MIPIVALTLRGDKIERKTAAFSINPHSGKWEEPMCTVDEWTRWEVYLQNQVDPAVKTVNDMLDSRRQGCRERKGLSIILVFVACH
jgi:hypothetical protein